MNDREWESPSPQCSDGTSSVLAYRRRIGDLLMEHGGHAQEPRPIKDLSRTWPLDARWSDDPDNRPKQ